MPHNPVLSRRGRILDALVFRLQKITTANGFATDVKNVGTNVKIWSDIGDYECPYLFVVDEKTHYNYHAGRLTERDWTVSIFGVIKNSASPQDDMEELISDIEACLMANVTLADANNVPTVSHTRITDIVTDRQLFAETEKGALFKVIIEIKYTATVDAIR